MGVWNENKKHIYFLRFLRIRMLIIMYYLYNIY